MMTSGSVEKIRNERTALLRGWEGGGEGIEEKVGFEGRRGFGSGKSGRKEMESDSGSCSGSRDSQASYLCRYTATQIM